MKLLIIEDPTNHLQDVEELLPPESFTIYFSHDKANGVEIAIRYLPQLILFQFSGPSDLPILELLFKNSQTSTIPIIIIAANPSFEEQRTVIEAGADDYLPIQLLRASLRKTLANRLWKIEEQNRLLTERINSLDEIESKPKKRDDHLLVKIGAKIKLVQFAEIVCIKALKEYCTVITRDNCKIIIRKSMNNWEKVLPPNAFLRIHRATIINLSYIESINKTGLRTYTVKLKHVAEPFDLSYRYANIMRQSFPK